MAEKILVVDDDVDSLKLIGLMLQRQGYEVIAANAGGPALQKAFQEIPSLIILDVMMPDMDGYEVCRRLRSEPSTQNIPIIMFTAKSMVDDKVAGFEAGADDYLTKPTHPAELSSRVRAVLQRTQQQAPPTSATPSGKQGYSIGFLGVKGGVGTSTLAANLGAALAKQDDTILADVRPGQGSLGVMLGYTRVQSFAQIMSRPPNEINARLVEDNLVTHNTGIKLVLSSTRPLESQINLTVEGLVAFHKAMSQLAYYRLLDMGAGLNRLSVKMMREVDNTILLVEPNLVTLELAKELMKEITNLEMAPERISVVVFNRTQTTVQVPWQEIEHQLNHEVAAIISPAPELAYQAGEAGMPMIHFQPNSIVAGQIGKLAEEFVKRGSG